MHTSIVIIHSPYSNEYDGKIKELPASLYLKKHVTQSNRGNREKPEGHGD